MGTKALKVSLVSTLLLVIIILIVLFTVLADTGTDVGAAAGNMSCTTWNTTTGCTVPSDVLPLTTFFKPKGIILLSMMAGVVILLIVAVLNISKSK